LHVAPKQSAQGTGVDLAGMARQTLEMFAVLTGGSRSQC
jgi:hypothetical protein